MRDKIPARIIHVSCPPAGESELSLLHQAALANARALHPNFEHVLFGNAEIEQFVREEFPECRAAMASFSQRIQRADFFRYLAVYRLGGFYFDLDVLLARNISPLLDHTCVLAFEELTLNKFLRRSYGMDWEVANYAFGAAPQNAFIGALIENCLRFVREPAWGYQMMQGVPRAMRDVLLVPFTTGPGMVSRTLAENPHLAKDVTILFPEDVCDERTWHQFGNFGIHLQQGAWRSRHSYLRRRLANLWESSIRRRLHSESRAQGKSRSVPLTRPVGVQKPQVIAEMLEAPPRVVRSRG
jgi:hypothetical protein